MGRRILVVTSGRADATPLAPVVGELRTRAVAWRIDLRPLPTTSPRVALADAMRDSVDEMYLRRPDLMLVLGDRYEILAACLAATVAKVPIAHIHGGEITRGSFDNQIRDAITKLSHVHFTATVKAALRVTLNLGEWPERVHHVGAPGLDNLTDLPERVWSPTIVLTYHPETLTNESRRGAKAIAEVLLSEYPTYRVIWTGTNNDPGADEINAVFQEHWPVSKLTAREYHLACRHAAFVIGNSSSGIIECPTIGVRALNVGSRQDGRECGSSVFSCRNDARSISTSLRGLLVHGAFGTNPYGGPGASKKIADILTSIELEGLLRK